MAPADQPQPTTTLSVDARPNDHTVTELRLALVCYGGVSLAIYMHGVHEGAAQARRGVASIRRTRPRGSEPVRPRHRHRARVLRDACRPGPPDRAAIGQRRRRGRHVGRWDQRRLPGEGAGAQRIAGRAHAALDRRGRPDEAAERAGRCWAGARARPSRRADCCRGCTSRSPRCAANGCRGCCTTRSRDMEKPVRRRSALAAAADDTVGPVRHDDRPGRLPDAGAHRAPAASSQRETNHAQVVQVRIERLGRRVRPGQRRCPGVRGPGHVVLPGGLPAGQPGAASRRSWPAARWIDPAAGHRRASAAATSTETRLETPGSSTAACSTTRRSTSSSRRSPEACRRPRWSGGWSTSSPIPAHRSSPSRARRRRTRPTRSGAPGYLRGPAARASCTRQGQPLDPARSGGLARPQPAHRRAGRRSPRQQMAQVNTAIDEAWARGASGTDRPDVWTLDDVGRGQATRRHDHRQRDVLRRRGLSDLLPAQGRGGRSPARRRGRRPIRLPARVQPVQLRPGGDHGLGPRAGGVAAARHHRADGAPRPGRRPVPGAPADVHPGRDQRALRRRRQPAQPGPASGSGRMKTQAWRLLEELRSAPRDGGDGRAPMRTLPSWVWI